MIIRKLFKIENAHIVRDCSSKRCKYSIHGHSYQIEVLFESDYLDNGQMVYDFGLMKTNIKDIIDSFDHAISLWDRDDTNYISSMKKYSQRYIELPVSPSAEQLSRVFFLLIDSLMKITNTKNGEKSLFLHSIIVHETQTGYAQCFKKDAYSVKMGAIDINNIIFSDAIIKDWNDKNLFTKIKDNILIDNVLEC